MKTVYKIELRDTSGRLHKFDFPINTHEVMKDSDIYMHILSLPYICVKETEYSKTLVPISGIACLKVVEGE